MFGLKKKELKLKKVPRSAADTTVYATLGFSADKAKEVCESMGAYIIRNRNKLETKTEGFSAWLKTEEFREFGLSITEPNDLFFLGMCLELVMTGISETEKTTEERIKKEIDEVMPFLQDKSPEEITEALQEIVGDKGKVRAIGVEINPFSGKARRFETTGKLRSKSINNGGIDPQKEN